jgi:hypothetical protein
MDARVNHAGELSVVPMVMAVDPHLDRPATGRTDRLATVRHDRLRLATPGHHAARQGRAAERREVSQFDSAPYCACDTPYASSELVACCADTSTAPDQSSLIALLQHRA